MYEIHEIERLLEIAEDGESLSEIELRNGVQWLEQKLRDGASLKEIEEAIIKKTSGENTTK